MKNLLNNFKNEAVDKLNKLQNKKKGTNENDLVDNGQNIQNSNSLMNVEAFLFISFPYVSYIRRMMKNNNKYKLKI